MCCQWFGFLARLKDIRVTHATVFLSTSTGVALIIMVHGSSSRETAKRARSAPAERTETQAESQSSDEHTQTHPTIDMQAWIRRFPPCPMCKVDRTNSEHWQSIIDWQSDAAPCKMCSAFQLLFDDLQSGDWTEFDDDQRGVLMAHAQCIHQAARAFHDARQSSASGNGR